MTLTATPIPRTLQMSVAGMRDLSVINTPPLDRKAIQTYLCRFEDSVIQGAIRKELARQGEIFFVHNKVETIDAMGKYLKKLVPEARIEIAHGQMSEEQLEKTMRRFLMREFDVLLCTTIIESGLDIASANTIIVNRADQFGLAQLYQLRGRVGRSDREAFAYLLIPGEELISKDAFRRLKVLKRFTELGSGLKVALHDLEIRGAGNLLGPSQSGHIAAVGLELYTQLLDREIRKLKGEPVQEEIEPEIQCRVPAFLPDDFVASTGERLLLYKRLSSTRSDGDLEQLRAEIRDRFGALPPTVENLMEVIGLKILARSLGIQVLRLTEKPSIEFADQAPVNIDRILKLIKKDKRLSLRPDNRLVLDLAEDSDTLNEVKKILQKLI
jgi:transcription-repair coupling factor (superfamily II helicase)